VLRDCVPASGPAQGGIDPRLVIGLGPTSNACTVLPTAVDRDAAVPLPGSRQPHESEAWSTRGSLRRTDQRCWAQERGEPGMARYGREDLVVVGVQGDAVLQRRIAEIYSVPERWIEAADWITLAAGRGETRTRLHRGLKWASARTGRLPQPRVPGRARPAVRGIARASLSTRSCSWAARAESLTAGGRMTGLTEGRAVRGYGKRRAHVTAEDDEIERGRCSRSWALGPAVMNGRKLAEVPDLRREWTEAS